MSRSAVRAVRLMEIQRLVRRNPPGLTTAELAKLCGVGLRTIQRDMLTLQSDLHIPVVRKEYDRYGLPEGYFLPPVSFSLYDAVGLFLAARLVMRQTDDRNPHIESALSRLSSILPLPVAEHLKHGICHFGKKASNPNYLHVFEQVAIAWSTQRRIRFKYCSLQSDEIKQWVIDPYFIEMTGTGYSTYVMGKVVSGERDGIITFKLDRIREVQLQEENFDIPEGLVLDDLLGSSWGVMWGEDVEVKLKFSPQATRRVKESNWHPSQVVEDSPGGGCILTMRVGNVLEMRPWIRGWGSDVEVLAPETLRKEMIQSVERSIVVYNISLSADRDIRERS